MPGRTPASDDDAAVEDEVEDEPVLETEAGAEIDEAIVAPDEDEDEEVVAAVVEEEEEEEDDDDKEDVEVAVVAPVRPTPRPQPGRPPSAKEEPPPPFAIGERVRLIQNRRPRTGTPIGDYEVGTLGRVETVLSQTAIVRFDVSPEIKEVVAFACLESAEPSGPGASDGTPVAPAPVPPRRSSPSAAAHPVAVLRGVPRPPAPRELPLSSAPPRLARAPAAAPSVASDDTSVARPAPPAADSVHHSAAGSADAEAGSPERGHQRHAASPFRPQRTSTTRTAARGPERGSPPPARPKASSTRTVKATSRSGRTAGTPQAPTKPAAKRAAGATSRPKAAPAKAAGGARKLVGRTSSASRSPKPTVAAKQRPSGRAAPARSSSATTRKPVAKQSAMPAKRPSMKPTAAASRSSAAARPRRPSAGTATASRSAATSRSPSGQVRPAKTKAAAKAKVPARAKPQAKAKPKAKVPAKSTRGAPPRGAKKTSPPRGKASAPTKRATPKKGRR